MEDLRKLPDKDLLDRTLDIARRERQITLELLGYIREVERRQLFLELGYPSLYDFVVRELKLSEGSAYRRIQAMRLLKDLPEAAEKIADGRLSLTTACKVQTALGKAPKEDREKMVAALEGKSSREAERELAKLDPRGPRELTRWLSAEEVQLTFSLERPTYQRLQELHSLRTHKDISKSYKVLVNDLIELGHEKWNPLRRRATSAPRSPCVTPEPVWKTVPPLLRREVWARDANACSFLIPGTDRRCGSRDLLQIDHIQPLALGGKNELVNLRLLCAAHNRARAVKTFGAFPADAKA